MPRYQKKKTKQKAKNTPPQKKNKNNKKKTRGVYLWGFKFKPVQKPTFFFQNPTGEFNLYVAMLDFFTRTCIDGLKNLSSYRRVF